MALQHFFWQNNQAITTPQAAQRARDLATALSSKPKPTNWAEGLAALTGGYAAGQLNSQANTAEQAGQSAVAAALSGLGSGSSEADLIAAGSNPWASPQQSALISALLGNKLEQQDPMYQARLAQLQAGGGEGQESFFGNVVPMQDASGNVVLGQMSNHGNWQPLQGAEGYTPAPTTKQIDTGTEIITQDVYGNELFRTPKQNRQAAYETGFGSVEGKTDAENAVLADSVRSKMPGLRSVIDTLTRLADTATYTQSGQAMDSIKRELGLPVGQGAIDRASYIAIVDNQVLPLLKDTFGSAFTVQEGESLRATLGDPNKSPPEKKAILDAFITQKERDVAAMAANGPGQSAPTSTQPSPVVRVYNPATGKLE